AEESEVWRTTMAIARALVASAPSNAIFEVTGGRLVHTQRTDHEHICSSPRHRSARAVHRSARPLQEGKTLLRECARTRLCRNQRIASCQHRGGSPADLSRP